MLKGAGLRLSSIELLHVNTNYVRSVDGICWPELFARLNLGEAVAEALVSVPDRLPAMRNCLDMVELPHAEPGSLCSAPYACEFWERCTAHKPADWIFYTLLT